MVMAKCCEYCGRGIEGVKRNTRKYCDDNCKQLAYYSRKGMSWGRCGLSGSVDVPFNVKSDFTLNDKGSADSEQQTVVVQKSEMPTMANEVVPVKSAQLITTNAIVDQPYRKVQSALLRSIERTVMQVEKYFELPENYWTSEAISNVKWVTVRLRCVLENLLRLSRVGQIDGKTIQQLSDALNSLQNSVYFRCLPRKYPFTAFILELKEKFQRMCQPGPSKRIPFRLSPERKAQFMAYRFVFLHFVPHLKFGELEFSDGIRKRLEKECD
jgi:hypothetical protein